MQQFLFIKAERVIKIRAFIGIDFDKELKNKIYELQQRLRRYSKKGSFKHIDNFHLTLKFLGEIQPVRKEQIDEAVKKICLDTKPFNLQAKGLGFFDGKDCIRVLWLGLAGNIDELQALQIKTEKALVPMGFPSVKRIYTPHITIGQNIVFNTPFAQIKDTVGKMQPGITNVKSLYMFKSEQIRNKRIYSKVSKYDFFQE